MYDTDIKQSMAKSNKWWHQKFYFFIWMRRSLPWKLASTLSEKCIVWQPSWIKDGHLFKAKNANMSGCRPLNELILAANYMFLMPSNQIMTKENLKKWQPSWNSRWRPSKFENANFFIQASKPADFCGKSYVFDVKQSNY